MLQGRVLDFGGSPGLDADRVSSQAAAAVEPQGNVSIAQQDRIAEIEAQIERLTAVGTSSFLAEGSMCWCAQMSQCISHMHGGCMGVGSLSHARCC